MRKTERIGNSEGRFDILECNQCHKELVLPLNSKRELIESKGWYVEKNKGLHLCKNCNQ